ncbi:MAG TPA: hypothetical protein VF215_02645 [Thermoanaerobaculia bacterium]
MAATAIPRTDSSLDDVLAVERELAELMGAERRKAARWLEERRREIESTAKAELRRLEQSAREDEETAKKSAAEKAAVIVEQSGSIARRIEALDDARLGPIVRKHLACLVPGVNR